MPSYRQIICRLVFISRKNGTINLIQYFCIAFILKVRTIYRLRPHGDMYLYVTNVLIF